MSSFFVYARHAKTLHLLIIDCSVFYSLPSDTAGSTYIPPMTPLKLAALLNKLNTFSSSEVAWWLVEEHFFIFRSCLGVGGGTLFHLQKLPGGWWRNTFSSSEVVWGAGGGPSAVFVTCFLWSHIFLLRSLVSFAHLFFTFYTVRLQTPSTVICFLYSPRSLSFFISNLIAVLLRHNTVIFLNKIF